ncbi:DoxX family protein [Amycolatopsis sp. 195334CR]|uniref:DoxX family protein n=1 Tax=Amycolatopsis sp. 195334CR TaxID=2814588 RepID=UPI001A8C2487|nr:DoxX family protein [Amycolatopsis sp. 195334CR]MBN6041714.1 DoxX family protein [Amycolatopsis sp. 195334CR]
MFAAYVTVTILGALINGAAATLYLIGHEYPKAQADMKGVPRKFVPLLGTLAASGLVLYFVGAIIAHLRVGSRDIVGGIVFLTVAAAALVLGLVHHG